MANRVGQSVALVTPFISAIISIRTIGWNIQEPQVGLEEVRGKSDSQPDCELVQRILPLRHL